MDRAALEGDGEVEVAVAVEIGERIGERVRRGEQLRLHGRECGRFGVRHRDAGDENREADGALAHGLMINKDRSRTAGIREADVNFSMITLLLFAGLLLALLVAAEIGRRIGIARIARDPEGLPKGVGAVEGAVFALLGLLLAFSFSGAASRFEDRRHLITAETNAIGTAYLRIDLLPAMRSRR